MEKEELLTNIYYLLLKNKIKIVDTKINNKNLQLLVSDGQYSSKGFNIYYNTESLVLYKEYFSAWVEEYNSTETINAIDLLDIAMSYNEEEHINRFLKALHKYLELYISK